MTSFPIQPFQKAMSSCRYLLSLLDKYSMPNPKYIPDKRELKLAHTRTKILLSIEAAIALLFGVNILIQNGPFLNNLQGMIACITVVIIGAILNRVHPELFKAFVNIINIGFGVLSALQNEEGPQGAWLVASNFPMVIYIATGSLWHFTFNIVIQFYLVNIFFQRMMKRYLDFADPDVFLRNLTFQTNQTIIYVAFLTIYSHILMKEALNQANAKERKRAVFEKQRDFLMGFSHELRNLLNSLMGNIKLASMEPITQKAKALLLTADFSAEMLLHQINNILDTGKAEVRDLEVNPISVQIYDLLERIWNISKELIKGKGLKGRFLLSLNIPKVLTLDHYRLTQVVLNLVGNAVKYTRTGEVDISVEWLPNSEEITEKCFEPIPFNEENDQDEGIFEKKRTMSALDESMICLNFVKTTINKEKLSSLLDYNKGVLKIIVRDTGIGIPKKELEKVFEKFAQVSPDPHSQRYGAGLGLYVTKELCERMNGEIRVYSQVGKGSTFSICLPLEPVIDEVSLLLNKKIISRLSANKNLKAMIVDDESFNHSVLKEFLTRLGVQVVEVASNGLVGSQKYVDRVVKRNEPVHIVTMDLSMPVMDGRVSAQKIREVEARFNLDACLLIIISGDCSESDIAYCMDVNGPVRADAFLKKPASVDEISRVISSYLTRIYRPEDIKRFIRGVD